MDKSIFDYECTDFSNIEELREYLVDEAEYSEEEVNEFSAYELIDKYLSYNLVQGYSEDIISLVRIAFKINEND